MTFKDQILERETEIDFVAFWQLVVRIIEGGHFMPSPRCDPPPPTIVTS